MHSCWTFACYFPFAQVGDVYPDECPQYSWTASSWGKCSVLCGQGVQKRDVWCQTDVRTPYLCFSFHVRPHSLITLKRSQNGFMVDPGLCPSSSMPEFSATCDMGECVWSPGPWTDCSVPCGGGSQNRALTCRCVFHFHDSRIGSELAVIRCCSLPSRPMRGVSLLP